jgi:hypothetical protein
MGAWAPSTRSSTDRCKSPKMPISKIVIQTIVVAQMNVASAVNAGRRRDAIQSSSGQTAPIASNAVQVSLGSRQPVCRAPNVAKANVKSRRGPRFPVDLNQQDEREHGYLVTPNRPTNYHWYSGEVL